MTQGERKKRAARVCGSCGWYDALFDRCGRGVRRAERNVENSSCGHWTKGEEKPHADGESRRH